MAGFAYLRWRLDMARHWPNVAKALPEGGTWAEVGTWRGASALRWLKRRPKALHLIDPYRCKPDGSWEGRLQQEALDAVRRGAMRRVNRRGAGVVSWLRLDSLDAARRFKDGSLCGAYIDGDHSFQAALDDLNAWWPKVRPGGAVVLDDHILGRWWGSGVVDAAEAFKPADESHRRQFGRWLVIHKGGA